jgi:hypothetical protein
MQNGTVSGIAESSGNFSTNPTYLWEISQKPVSVRIDLQIVTRLDWKVVQAAGSGGAEIGGLLLGSITSGSPSLITLDDYELVPCDYGFGPLYQLTTQDRERFARCAAARSAARGLQVVGFFRSHTRAGLALDSDDIKFCTAQFGQPHQVVLLIRPAAGQVSRAGIFIWEDGEMRAEASYLEFPFSQDELLKQGSAAVPTAGGQGVPHQQTSNSGAPAAQGVAVPGPPKRAQIVPLVPRREVAQTPSAAAGPKREVSQISAPSAKAQERGPSTGVAGAEWLPARVGRCNLKVQLRPAAEKGPQTVWR